MWFIQDQGPGPRTINVWLSQKDDTPEKDPPGEENQEGYFAGSKSAENELY